jgi:hypothetical protein
MTLREIFEHAKRRKLPQAWLYLPADVEWTVDTDGTFIDCANVEKDDADILLEAKRKNLRETLDDGTIEAIVDWADRLAGREDPAARLDVFRYYFRFDAFPDRLGSPDPPPVDEIIRSLDRKFYDSMAVESTESKCRHEGCSRGVTKFSIFCRVHHFEQIKKSPVHFVIESPRS